MLKSLVSGIKLYLDKRLKEQRDETDERIADAKWHETTATQLFSETVTTENSGPFNVATLAYSEFINADTITVIFDETEYTCDKLSQIGTTSVYGAPATESGCDFSEYPFLLGSGNNEGGVLNMLYTETPGTHTISVSTKSTTYTDAFKNAVQTLSGAVEVDDPNDADIVVLIKKSSADTSVVFSGFYFDNDGSSIAVKENTNTVDIFNLNQARILYKTKEDGILDVKPILKASAGIDNYNWFFDEEIELRSNKDTSVSMANRLALSIRPGINLTTGVINFGYTNIYGVKDKFNVKFYKIGLPKFISASSR